MKTRQVTVTPRYALDQVVEADAGRFGKILLIKAETSWNSKENGVTKITYFLSNGNGSEPYGESAIKRVVSES